MFCSHKFTHGPERKTRPIEALNGTQKNIIEGTLKFYFDDLHELDILCRVIAFNAMISPAVTDETKIRLIKANVWESVKVIRDIISHPCPQNRREGNPDYGLPDHLNYIVYTDKNGNPAFEEKGLLSLTARNDLSAPHVTKESVVNYITRLVNYEIEISFHQLPGRRYLSSEKERLVDSLCGNEKELSAYLVSLKMLELEQTMSYMCGNIKYDLLTRVLLFLSHEKDIFKALHTVTIGTKGYNCRHEFYHTLFVRPEFAEIISENLITLLKMQCGIDHEFLILNAELGRISSEKLSLAMKAHRQKNKETMGSEWAMQFLIADHLEVFEFAKKDESFRLKL